MDYVAPQNVYVDFYRQLPEYNSSIIVIRSHSSDTTLSGQTIINNDVLLFTSQPYAKDLYVDEQVERELFLMKFLDRKQKAYFGIGPKFVENEMEGNFKKGTIVIVMGCDSLTNNSLADAFFKKVLTPTSATLSTYGPLTEPSKPK